ncbi:hypothetical protein N7476_009617 [Penicillium atrosanguineum]|uniref:Ferric oxidoreductase domain-containing protein n=1 Tax=Penicillium atrosanguineum TaxID=1132637 RepID=A0A9W9U0J5_9EURO|nr:hypothetical protein N7526_008238 [Penicillium atrosanguineum]KAJ5302818.1 hypothetical protein N7476_009617 [Penicillium atrosanguineum]
MTRITPRTCLYPLAGSLLLTFGLSIGLTFRSDHHCYAGTCGEWLFPLQARLHVVVWYSWILISVAFFAVRAFQPRLRRYIQRRLFNFKLPLVGEQLALSALLGSIWIITLYGIIVGVWWIRLRDYFVDRGQERGVQDGNYRLAAIALTGHLCDVTMGMVLIPVSRHSALASFFKLSVSTTLTFHMLIAYTLFTLVIIHGLIYVSWVPAFNSLSERLREVFPVLNPTYLYHETWPGNPSALGVWRASLIFTGIVSTTIMGLIFVTTLPKIRVKYFNVFYFTHLLSIVAVIVICLHASTIFYCVSPGLAMWVLDWGMRLYELRECVHGKVIHLGNGWYCIELLLPRHRLDGCACQSPLAHFYIRHANSSAWELHPFTTITPLASESKNTASEEDIPIQFIFRKRGGSGNVPHPQARKIVLSTWFNFFRNPTKPTIQWTDKLASIADKSKPLLGSGDNSEFNQLTGTPSFELTSEVESSTSYPQSVDVSLRLEGPYFTVADPSRYKTVICMVAGTGVSGAIAIARAFLEQKRQQMAVLEIGSEWSANSRPANTSICERCVIICGPDYVT